MQNNVEFAAPPPLEGVGGGGTGYGWNEDAEVGGGVVGSEIDIARHATSDLVHVWCMPSTAIIGHQEPPRSLEQVSLLAARNERECTNCNAAESVVGQWGHGGIPSDTMLRFLYQLW